MIIKKLPQYLINKLKAGEIVERPSSIVKELIENSIDAKSQNIILKIIDGGIKLIQIEDDGTGIENDDLDNSIQRYATSKISCENDLNSINSYGFRGEALASISEVSKFRIQTKVNNDNIGNELIKIGDEVYFNQIPFNKNHGTIVYVEDIFFNTPVRKKFLKSIQTESKYINDVFIDYALVNYNISFSFYKDGKLKYDLLKANSLLERIFDIYKKDREKYFKIVQAGDKYMNLVGVVSDANLTFLNQDQIKIFVNNRPVNDKIIKKSLLQVYERQIPHGEYPFAVLFFEIVPENIDVNVHPRKIEVKFVNPGNVFNFVKNSLEGLFSNNKTIGGDFSYKKNNNETSNVNNFFEYRGEQIKNDNTFKQELLNFDNNNQIYIPNNLDDNNMQINSDFKIVGQIWDSYIILEGNDGLYFVDQHAIAERILFEKMKLNIVNNGIKYEPLLNPIILLFPKNIDINQQIDKLNGLGFDISLFSQDKYIVYTVPSIFIEYNIDIVKLLDKLILLNEMSIDKILEEIFASKACKASIKSGLKLSYLEMKNLIQDGFKYIDKMFVCQHGRPSFVKIEKKNILKLFDRLTN